MPNPDQIRNSRSLAWLGDFLHDPYLWHFNRRSVSGAFAVGLFVCFIPIPLQMLQAAALAILFRVNLPLSVAVVWLTNPVTIPPFFYLAYQVGAFLLGTELEPFYFEFSLDWLFLELGSRWRPFLLGCLVLGTVSSLSGFVTVRILWRLHLLQRLRLRRGRYTSKA